MAYQDDVVVSEGARQVAKAATNTAAGHLAADIQHYTNLVTASRKWGVRNGAMAKLLSIGGSAPAGSFQPIDF
jgi:hypothetical protein